MQPLTVGLEQPLQSVAAIAIEAAGQDIIGQHVGQACLECLLNDVG